MLLRAVTVTVDVSCSSAHAARLSFAGSKFLGLLHTITRHNDGYRIVIDGPFSLFESVTKYGQKLAMVLPVLEPCQSWKLSADVRWGKERMPLVFHLQGGSGGAGAHEPAVSDELSAFVRAFNALESGFRVSDNQAVLDMPGTGLCIPDLVFTRSGTKVYLEVMGFWSRDAVSGEWIWWSGGSPSGSCSP